ncbi:MAG TPA: glycosyltransferase family 2 protein [Candidatus Ratteibacteria bacterium]|nr:glycosyltransferase family 2 protein [Candidatus Ratteibacteria bacterium]
MQKNNLKTGTLSDRIELTIVIPARNEESNLERTVEDILKYIDTSTTEIIIVNDHSTDRTEEIGQQLSLKYSFIKVINNKNEPGFSTTLLTGFKQAKGEYVLPVMADMCDDPGSIQKMLEKAKDSYDIVCGSRYTKGGKKIGGPKIQNFFSFFVCKSLRYLINLPTNDVSNAFKLYKKNIFNIIKPKEKGFAISMEITLKSYFYGSKITEIPTTWYGRKKGKSKFKLIKTFPYVKLYFWAILKKWKFL